MRLVFLHIAVVLFVLSALGTKDLFTWTLESIWFIIAVGILYWKREWKFTPLLQWLLFLVLIINTVGAYYTFSKVPLGFWMEDWFGFTRNNYDRIAHFFQGFGPAILMRELYRRFAHVGDTAWLFLFVTSFCLAFSALFEIMEGSGVGILGAGASDYLGMQGDKWDAQWDMFYCLIGAVTSQLLLGRLHEKQLRKL